MSDSSRGWQENIQNSQELREKKKISGGDIVERLAHAFGGYSQIGDDTVGEAIAGQVNNGELIGKSIEECLAVFEQAVDAICERWENDDPMEVRNKIIGGMKNMAREWQREDAPSSPKNRVWILIESLEAKK